MILEGKQKCEHCPETFYWYHIVGDNAQNNLYQVHTIPKEKTPVRQVLEFDENKNPTKVLVKCPSCEGLNTFNI